jgi:hypothetical protein
MTADMYIYKKEVDWSVLHLGLNIPVSIQESFYSNIKFRLNKGERKKLKLLIDGCEYTVDITNIFFDERRYHRHKELLQLRYTPNSAIAKKIRSIFYNSYNYLSVEKEKLVNKRQRLSVPADTVVEQIR